MVTGGSCGARPPSCSVVRVAPARRCGFVGAGPAAAALTVSPFLLWVGAPPRPWGGGGPRLWLPSWGGCGGGGGGAPRLLSGLCGRGGGGEWGGVLRLPGDAPCRPKKKGGGAAWRSQPRGPAIGQGGRALPPPPSTECRILPQSLPGASHLPAVAARRWPAGGGREGQRSVVSGLRGRLPWVGNKAGVPWRRAVHGGRGHPYHSGSRLGRRGGSHSGSPLGRGGPSLQPRGVGAGVPAAGGPAGGRGGGGVSRRGLPALVPGGGLWHSFPALSASPVLSLPARACGRG